MDRLASRDWVRVSLSGSGASLVEMETRACGGGGVSSEHVGAVIQYLDKMLLRRQSPSTANTSIADGGHGGC